jgi:Flp pilus assembly protein TadB
LAHYPQPTVASQKSKRRSRKRRNPEAAPRAVPSARRDERAERRAQASREIRRGDRQLGREGQRPESPFGGLPISEIAILVGGIGLVIAFIQGGGPVLIVAIIVCALGVMEITGREHFSGYRSHTLLLAAVPAVALESVVVGIWGEPNPRVLLLAVVVPVFAVLFWVLRRKFRTARQARVARPPAP